MTAALALCLVQNQLLELEKMIHLINEIVIDHKSALNNNKSSIIEYYSSRLAFILLYFMRISIAYFDLYEYDNDVVYESNEDEVINHCIHIFNFNQRKLWIAHFVQSCRECGLKNGLLEDMKKFIDRGMHTVFKE